MIAVKGAPAYYDPGISLAVINQADGSAESEWRMTTLLSHLFVLGIARDKLSNLP